jgi:histidyl-tRNA synthetase
LTLNFTGLSQSRPVFTKTRLSCFVLQGPEEVNKGLATVKDLRQETQVTIAQDELAQYIKQNLLLPEAENQQEPQDLRPQKG